MQSEEEDVNFVPSKHSSKYSVQYAIKFCLINGFLSVIIYLYLSLSMNLDIWINRYLVSEQIYYVLICLYLPKYNV